jgi:hypothetical protein
MEKTFAKVEELADTVKEFVNNRIESAKLTAAEKGSAVVAVLIAGLIVAVIFTFCIVFAGVALSLVLGEWIGKTWAGFLIVAGFYLLLGIIIWAARDKIIRLPIMNVLIKQLFREENEED